MGEEITMDSLAGNAARFVAESELDEGVQHAVAEQMGAPTERGTQNCRAEFGCIR